MIQRIRTEQSFPFFKYLRVYINILELGTKCATLLDYVRKQIVVGSVYLDTRLIRVSGIPNNI